MATSSEVLARVDALNKRQTEAAQRHAVAEAQYNQAQDILKEANAELTKLGIDPKDAEAQLHTELGKLDAEVTARDAEITAALANYQEVDRTFRALSAL